MAVEPGTAGVLALLSDADTLALTALAEAVGDHQQGGSSVEERIAVMSVIRNRVRTPLRFGGATYKAVCLKNNGRTWQFDCWRPGSGANHDRLMAMAYLLVTGQPLLQPYWEETRFLAGGVVRGVILDRVSGATHFYAPKTMKPVGAVPKWARGVEPCAAVGSQLFFVNV